MAKTMSMSKIGKVWTERAARLLVGRTIKAVRYMTRDEANKSAWWKRPLVLELDDGNLVTCQSDDEGNDAGAMIVNDPVQDHVFPALPC